MSTPLFYRPSRNPYYTKLRDLTQTPGQKAVFMDEQSEDRRGQWASEGQPLHVEIGCNGGHVILEWARMNPSRQYVGLDWKFKQIHRGVEKAQTRSLPNLTFARAHADRLEHIFAPGEVDALYLFFPDPWPKKGQRKNRLVQDHWLNRAFEVLKPGGSLEIKTDHRGYFDHMLEELAKCPQWEVSFKSFDLHQDHPNPLSLEIPEVTLFEKVWIREGLPVHRLLLHKPAQIQ